MVKKKIVALSTYLSELAVHGIQEKKGEDIVRLDLRNIHTSVADYFIIASANSGTQVKAIADSVEKKYIKPLR
ncbi:Ribosomal silencing factor RsfS [compost metagenome]